MRSVKKKIKAKAGVMLSMDNIHGRICQIIGNRRWVAYCRMGGVLEGGNVDVGTEMCGDCGG
ncbi:MAG: hypothetical protein GX977_10810 [Firmicutes bacterium]|nr:hypothetical protein [Bacillota bacterium]